nr:hypothetical protein Csa_3G850615 [Ipomoea batatas]
MFIHTFKSLNFTKLLSHRCVQTLPTAIWPGKIGNDKDKFLEDDECGVKTSDADPSSSSTYFPIATAEIEMKIPKSEAETLTNISWPPCVNSLMSIKSPYQVMHPVPPSLIFALAYAVHEQLLRQSSRHSSSPMVVFTAVISVSGIFMFSSFKNPSPLRQTSVWFLQHPWLQSWFDLALNPETHLQENPPGPQMPNAPQ